MSKKSWISFAWIVPCLFLITWGTVYFEETRLSRIMRSQLQGKGAELDRELTQFAVVPRLLARDTTIVNALVEGSGANIEAANLVLLRAQQDSNASFAFVMNRQGNTIAASNYLDDVSFIGVNYGFRPYFKGALDRKEATFFAVGATTGIPGYFVANPILDGGEIVGVVTVKFDLAGLLDSCLLYTSPSPRDRG